MPNFFIIHPLSDRVVAMPDPMTNEEDFSSELIMLWALRTAHGLDVELFEYNIQLYEEKEAKGEEIEEWEKEKYAEAKENLKESQEKKAAIDKEFAEAGAKIKEAKEAAKSEEPTVEEL